MTSDFSTERRRTIPRWDKSSCTDKRKRKAEHIEEGYEDRGVGHKEAERRTWATVNKESGGKKAGSGRGKKDSHESSREGGRKGRSSQSSSDRSAAAKKGGETRRRNDNG
jgi:hypothetical protein